MEMQELGNILFQIDNGVLALPKFQRGYVWKRADVSELMLSLYKGYPVGHLLVWDTPASPYDVKGNQLLSAGAHKLLLDGQQRVTSLYGIVRGKKPAFSDGNPKAFLDLYFNVEDEVFEFYSSKMKNDPLWISVTELMQAEMGEHQFLPKFSTDKQVQYSWRLAKITKIKERKIFVDTVTSANKTLEDVVDIFNRVNSGGTKLTDGDLALAKISAKWPNAREEMQKRLAKWRNFGYQFSLDWLLRCINALVTGQAQFQFIAEASAEDFQNGLKRAEKYIDNALTLLRMHLGLVDSSVLRSPNSIPSIVSYFNKINGIPDYHQQCRLLYWYVFSALRGRYSTASETAIRQDLVAIAKNDNPVTALIRSLEENYGDLKLHDYNFDASTSRSRFFPMLYMMTCVFGARDLCGGFKLSKTAIGAMANLERHHIFPKSQLWKHGINNVKDVNALANFTFLTAPCNGEISNTLPEKYFPFYEDKNPGVLASHWIPDDPELWKIENYHEFLAARRELLAEAANDFLGQLYHGEIAEAPTSESTLDQRELPRPASVASDEEDATLNEAMDWMERHGLPRGEYGFEIVSADGELLATLDLAWPYGIQVGRGPATALLINEDAEILDIARQHDYKYFTTVEQLQQYVQQEILGEMTPV